MNLKFEIFLLFLGGIIRIIVTGSDLWYIFSVNYQTTLMLYLSIASLIAPSFIILVAYFIVIVYNWREMGICNKRSVVALLFIIGDSLGINYFIFTFILCSSNIYSGDVYIVDAMFRGSSLINSLFQSMPQLILQVYNNNYIEEWSLFSIFSLGASGLSLTYNCVKLVYAVDKIQQYETVVKASNINPDYNMVASVNSTKHAHNVKHSQKSSKKIADNQNNVVITESEQDYEIYDLST